MIVVSTPTGDIGSKVVERLLAAKQAVRVIVRDPAKLAPEVLAKIEVIQGSNADDEAVSRACEGAESLFWVVPPSFGAEDFTEYYLQLTRPACRAIVRHRVQRVVAVSTLGRGIASPPGTVDAGPINSSLAKDAEIERTGVNFRALWCPGFMENMLRQIGTLKNEGVFYAPTSADGKLPQASTRDIAASAVRLLLDTSWSGQGGLAVLGPEDLSNNDMAAIMSEVLGKPIRFQRVPAEAYQAQLFKFGASAAAARSMLKMFTAKDNGLDNAEPRTPENTTPTSFRQWCEEVLKPAMQ